MDVYGESVPNIQSVLLCKFGQRIRYLWYLNLY